MLNRRSLITGLVAFVAAPAIVRVSSLMSIKSIDDAQWQRYTSTFIWRTELPPMQWRYISRIVDLAIEEI